MKSSLVRFTFGTLASLSLAVTASAQNLQVGGTRATGLGGAGLALPTQVGQNFILNPAFLGQNRGFSFGWPGIAARLDDLDYRDLEDIYDSSSGDGSFDEDGLIDFANRFGRRRYDVGTELTLGLAFGRLGVYAVGRANLATIPNAELRSFNPGGSTLPSASAQLDAYGVGYTAVGVSYAHPIPTGSGSLSVGGTAKFVTAYYSHKIVQYDGFGAAEVVNGSGLTDDTEDKQGFGVDLGTLFKPKGWTDSHVGLTIDNLVLPRTRFDRQVADSSVVERNRVNPFRTQYNLGVGGTVARRYAYAVDVLDATNRNGLQQLAMGAEASVLPWLGFRAGYNSRTRFTLGANVAGINVAIGDRFPLSIGTQYRF